MNAFDYDLHTHTQFSDGRSPVHEMAHAARANGLKGFVLADHIFSQEQADQLREKYAAIDRNLFETEILFGCETAVKDETGLPCARPDQLQKFDLVLMDFNGILFRKLASQNLSCAALSDLLCDIMIRACGNKEVTIMAHPFNFGLDPMNVPLEIFDTPHLEAVADAFRQNGKVFEIMNQMYFWHAKKSFADFHTQYMRILSVFKAAGVRFSLGSDAHSCCGIGCFRWSEQVVKELGVEQELFIPDGFRNK